MIGCPKCGGENDIGAIFCRSCGEKLDLDEVQPTDLVAKKQGGLSSLGTIIRNLVSLAVLIVLGIVLLSLFLKPNDLVMMTLDPEAQTVAWRRFGNLMKAKEGETSQFTEQEINYVAQRIVYLDEEGRLKTLEENIANDDSSMLVPQEIYIDLVGPGEARITLRSLLWNKLNVYTTVTGQPTAYEGGMDFTLHTVTMGKVPIPLDFLYAPLIDRFRVLLAGSEMWPKARERVISVVCESDKITLGR